MQHDRARFEQGEPYSSKVSTCPNGCRAMRRLLLRAEGEIAHVVMPADLFQRPANAQVAHQALGAIGHPVERGG